MNVRFARDNELDDINRLRKVVSDIHSAGIPEVFKAGPRNELWDLIYEIQKDPEKEIIVAEENGEICGYAILHHINKPENAFRYEQDYLDIDEFAVDSAHRRQGIASALVAFIREYARDKGFHRIELNMWEFNQSALAFYEAAGFKTYRRYMEMKV
ncbi:MAG: GNAT family N-acetyltransferase [Clostridia bacterium]|nr:GNAT family N-acetyltransferase [Clostridia bacterium]